MKWCTVIQDEPNVRTLHGRMELGSVNKFLTRGDLENRLKTILQKILFKKINNDEINRKDIALQIVAFFERCVARMISMRKFVGFGQSGKQG